MSWALMGVENAAININVKSKIFFMTIIFYEIS